MAKLYKYGVHEGVKYNPRVTQFRLCIICGQPFFDIPPRSKKQVCSDECDRIRKNTIYNKIHNFKNNPINNANKVYQPPKNEQERRKRNNYWKTWYANTTEEYKAKYNKRKYKKNDNDEPEVSTEEELDALYAELGLTRN